MGSHGGSPRKAGLCLGRTDVGYALYLAVALCQSSFYENSLPRLPGWADSWFHSLEIPWGAIGNLFVVNFLQLVKPP